MVPGGSTIPSDHWLVTVPACLDPSLYSSCLRMRAWLVLMSTHARLASPHVSACVPGQPSCQRMRAWLVLMSTHARLASPHVSACVPG